MVSENVQSLFVFMIMDVTLVVILSKRTGILSNWLWSR